MNRLFALLILLAIGTSASAQYVAHYEKKALASFYSKDYSTALMYSEKVIQADSQNVASLFMAGESARMLQDFRMAEAYLQKIPDEAKAGYYAVTDYRLGSVKHDLSKLEEAKFYYEKYLVTNHQDNDLLAFLANRALEDLAAGERGRRSDLVELERLGDNINSELSELSPLRYADKLYFSSVDESNTIRTGRKSKRQVNHPVTRIYEAQFDRSARLLDDVNPNKATKNAGNMALMPDASRMYYTLCNDNDYRNQADCEIWYRDRQYEGDWGPAVRLPEHINKRGASTTQPSIAYDQHLQRFALFFSSDRPDGKGGMDIWCSVLNWKGTEFGEPFLLPLNTEMDEVSPFFHQSSQTLFFSSNGLKTIGGLDIFKIKKDSDGDWAQPENLGEYVNSDYDDLYYSYHTKTRNAYFVSNRPGSKCRDEKHRDMSCTDIYQARIFVDLELQVFDQVSKSVLYGTRVELLDTGTGTTSNLVSPDGSNQVRVRLEPGKSYKLTVNADSHQAQSIELDTGKYSSFETLDQQVYLSAFAKP